MYSRKGQRLTDVFRHNLILNNTWIGPAFAALYLIAVALLKRYMENRPPYNVKKVMRIYDVLQVVYNSYVLFMVFRHNFLNIFLEEYCYPSDFTLPVYANVTSLINVVLVLKVIDFIDTFFIVLKKKGNQLSFLHLFHHSVVVAGASMAIAEGEIILFPVIPVNAFVHALMYFYYLLASYKSQRAWTSKYKHWITRIQLIQFYGVLSFLVYAIANGCQWGQQTFLLSFIFAFVLIYQFSLFYYKSFIEKKKQ